MDHFPGMTGRALRPQLNMNDYGAEIAREDNETALRLMVEKPGEDKALKRKALIGYLQYGLDMYHMMQNGQTWPSGGGEQPGLLLAWSFTATVMDHQGMRDVLRYPMKDVLSFPMQEGEGEEVYPFYQDYIVGESKTLDIHGKPSWHLGWNKDG